MLTQVIERIFESDVDAPPTSRQPDLIAMHASVELDDDDTFDDLSGAPTLRYVQRTRTPRIVLRELAPLLEPEDSSLPLAGYGLRATGYSGS